MPSWAKRRLPASVAEKIVANASARTMVGLLESKKR
jgi:hypothetical protein